MGQKTLHQSTEIFAHLVVLVIEIKSLSIVKLLGFLKGQILLDHHFCVTIFETNELCLLPVNIQNSLPCFL